MFSDSVSYELAADDKHQESTFFVPNPLNSDADVTAIAQNEKGEHSKGER